MHKSLARVAIVCSLIAAISACYTASSSKRMLAGEPTAPKAEATRAIADGHNLLQETERSERALAPGDRIPALRFFDLEGEAHYIGKSSGEKSHLFVFMSTSCPLVKRYTERLKRLHESAGESVEIFGVFSNHEDDRDSVRKHVELVKLPFHAVHDADGYLARSLGAEMTPQAFLIDREGTLRYRGAIDDNRYESRVKEAYLADAISALADGRPIEAVEGKSLGCTIHLADIADIEESNYSRHVARILQDNCQACHRPGQVAPFSLVNYDDAKTWATEIGAYTASRVMPPWKAAPGYGHFQNTRSLSDGEIELVARWVEAGAPEGDPREAPPAPRFAEGWAFGEPDLVVEMPEEYVVGPEGEDDYRHFIVPTSFDHDVFVEAVDVQPGNRQTVHHVIVYTDTSGEAREMDANDPGPGYTNFGGPGFDPKSMVGGWAPGTMPTVLPKGTGTWIPKGADIVMQVHYYRTGVEERDRTKVGLYFSKHPRPAKVRSVAVINTKFKIPPGDERHQVNANWTVPRDLYVLSVYPHMHLLGKEMKVFAEPTQGGEVPMIWVKDWDFNWQGYYFFQDPLKLEKDAHIRLLSYFDNSAGNPNNPHDPPQRVGWGEKTTDEMSIAFLSVVAADEFERVSDDYEEVAQAQTTK